MIENMDGNYVFKFVLISIGGRHELNCDRRRDRRGCHGRMSSFLTSFP
jgi:hypothetical protein